MWKVASLQMDGPRVEQQLDDHGPLLEGTAGQNPLHLLRENQQQEVVHPFQF
jgi:hypothetical protein